MFFLQPVPHPRRSSNTRHTPSLSQWDARSLKTWITRGKQSQQWEMVLRCLWGTYHYLPIIWPLPTVLLLRTTRIYHHYEHCCCSQGGGGFFRAMGWKKHALRHAPRTTQQPSVYGDREQGWWTDNNDWRDNADKDRALPILIPLTRGLASCAGLLFLFDYFCPLLWPKHEPGGVFFK